MIGRGVFLINDTSVSGHPGCTTVMTAIRDNLEMRGLAVGGRWPMGAEPQLGLARSAALRAAAAVVVNGEGTLHNTQSRPGARRLMQAIKQARRATDAPIFLINATIENLRPRDFELLRSCAGVFLRDRRSCDYAAAHGLATRFTPDLCFAAARAAAPRGAALVMTDSTLPEATDILRRTARRTGAYYLPMQPPRLSSLMHWMVTPRRHERAAARYFAAVSAAARLVTGRFHAVVFALMTETPFLALGSNTAKIQSLLADVLGSEARLIGDRRLAVGAPEVPLFDEQERARIRAYRAAAVAQAQSMFDHIGQAAALRAARA